MSPITRLYGLPHTSLGRVSLALTALPLSHCGTASCHGLLRCETVVFWVVNSLMSVYTAVFTVSYAVLYRQEPIELLIRYGCLNLTPVYTRKLYGRTRNTVRCGALPLARLSPLRAYCTVMREMSYSGSMGIRGARDCARLCASPDFVWLTTYIVGKSFSSH